MAADPPCLSLSAVPLGDLDEVDGQSVRSWGGTDLVPAVEGFGIVGLEGDRLSGGHGTAVVLLDDRVRGRGERVPQALSDEVGGAPPDQALGLGIDVGEAPAVVQEVDAGGDGRENLVDAAAVDPRLG